MTIVSPKRFGIKHSCALLILLILAFFFPCSSIANGPDCTGLERWPTKMAFVHLKNAGITDKDKLDYSKTKTVRLASERIGENAYRQIHYITFSGKSGTRIEVITSNIVSDEECSISDLEIFFVIRRLVSQN